MTLAVAFDAKRPNATALEHERANSVRTFAALVKTTSNAISSKRPVNKGPTHYVSTLVTLERHSFQCRKSSAPIPFAHTPSNATNVLTLLLNPANLTTIGVLP